jgi:hypothetical protein
MKKHLILSLVFMSLALKGLGQLAQFTIKSTSATTVQLYFKPTANLVISSSGTHTISNLNFILQIPASYPNPNAGWAVTPNGAYLGAISKITVQNALAPVRWNTLFTTTSNPDIAGLTFTAGTEYLLATMTIPPGVALQDITLIDWGNNRLDNALSGSPIYSTSILIDGSDRTNDAAIFYQSSTSLAPSNGGVINAQSTLTLSGTPLSIKVVAFQGKLNNNVSNLQWTARDEAGTEKYEVLWSSNGINWTKAGDVTAVNKGVSHIYFFNHDSRQSSGFLYYRLRIVALSGESEYSEVVRLNISSNATDDAYMVYPTVLQSGADIKIVTPSGTGNHIIRIKDQQGNWLERYSQPI